MTKKSLWRRPGHFGITRAVADLSELKGVTDKILVFRDGVNEGKWAAEEWADEFIFDDVAAEQVIRKFKDNKRDLVIDYEHGTENANGIGMNVAAPAAGWITDMRFVEGEGLWLSVNWTAKANQMIQDREYRYFSPVFFFDSTNGRVNELLSLALTNTPALRNLQPLAASRWSKKPWKSGSRAQWTH